MTKRLIDQVFGWLAVRLLAGRFKNVPKESVQSSEELLCTANPNGNLNPWVSGSVVVVGCSESQVHNIFELATRNDPVNELRLDVVRVNNPRVLRAFRSFV